MARRANVIIGAIAVGASLALLAVWIPFDTDSGIVERARRRMVIGDALAPTVAAVFICLGGLGLLTVERRADDAAELSAANLIRLAKFLAVLVASFALMRWTGPVAAELLQWGDGAPYRLLRDTPPWKYLGFGLGGTVLIAGMIALVEGQLRPRTILIAVLAVAAMVAIYDLPFDDLLLPPNGDV